MNRQTVLAIVGMLDKSLLNVNIAAQHVTSPKEQDIIVLTAPEWTDGQIEVVTQVTKFFKVRYKMQVIFNRVGITIYNT